MLFYHVVKSKTKKIVLYIKKISLFHFQFFFFIDRQTINMCFKSNYRQRFCNSNTEILQNAKKNYFASRLMYQSVLSYHIFDITVLT